VVVKKEQIVDQVEAQRVLATLKKSKHAIHFGVPVDVTRFTDYPFKVFWERDLSLKNYHSHTMILYVFLFEQHTHTFTHHLKHYIYQIW